MASAVARAYIGGLGAKPQWVRGQSFWLGGQGAKPPKAEAFFGFWTFNGSRKFAHFSKLWKHTKTSDICVIFAKKSWVATKGPSPARA